MIHKLPLWFFLFCCNLLSAQIIYTDPVFPKAGDQVTIYFDATQGTGGLADCNCEVYLHTGVITNLSSGPSDWKYVQTDWGVANPAWKLDPVPGEPNLYSYVIGPSITGYYGVPGGETIEELAFVFRNANGALEGKDDGGADIFYPVYPDDFAFTTILLSPAASSLIVEIGANIDIRFVASEDASITLVDNGNTLTQVTGQSLDYTLNVTEEGAHLVEITAATDNAADTRSFTYTVPLDLEPADPPAGSKPGITFVSGAEVRLLLYAPNKDNVFVVGDFNGYLPDTDYQMTKSLDGNTYWIEIDGLAPGEHYTFQYLVDGQLKIADPYSTVVLDPSNDPFIPANTYPNLPAYPTDLTSGVVTLLQPGALEYEWQTGDFERPAKEELVVYELLLRDFLARHDYTTLIDTLSYLERLGVNAIELMPVNEFEGNISWGYNPSFHLALDKYYGPINEFKRFIDECHSRGIAVILDVVYNHAFGQSPLARLYWDEANFRPAAENPWLNVEARHPFNVGYDFNHESQATKDFVDQALTYWLAEFRVDGFRFDLSKGFTQTLNTDVGAWGAYDASRINILKHYADVVWATTPGAYVILEHFADNTEEKELADYGMMLWGNMNHDYNEASMGYPSNFNWASYQARGWSDPHLVAYMESHDEERLMYKNLQFGNSSGNYNVKDLPTALDRIELVSTFFYTIPGPKMLWQFGELGYDFSINHCPNGANNPNCRVDPKPIRWDYQGNFHRTRVYDVTRALIHLKTNYEAFNTTDFDLTVGGSGKVIHLNHATMDVAAQGNFGVASQQISDPFPHGGMWYEYFSRDSLMVNDPNAPINLDPGQYRLYTTQRIELPGGIATGTKEETGPFFDLQVRPNPSSGKAGVIYHLVSGGRVKLDIYNLSGQVVLNLLNEGQPAGSYSFELNKPLPPGAYLLKLRVDDRVEVVRLVVK